MLVRGNSITFEGQTSASLQVDLPIGAPTDVLAIYGAPSGVTIYAGEVFTAPQQNAVVLPTRVDWQLLYGTGPCSVCDGGSRALRTPLWETTPAALGSTFLVATPNREGVLWHASVAGATAWLLRAGTTQAVPLRVTLVIRPWGNEGCCGATVPAVAAGSAIG